MKDYYRILGVSRHASPTEIRAAYLARMKICHPDAAGGMGQEAAEISQAYWQLRDAERRTAHDLLLGAPPSPTTRRALSRTKPKVLLAKSRPKVSQAAPRSRIVGAKSSRPPPRSKRLDPIRAAAGVAACSLAVMVFTVAWTHFGARVGPAEARAAAAFPAKALSMTPAARRPIDATLAAAAADEFRAVVARSGVTGAHLYARQCLMELTVRPSVPMLDYCLAFDDEASAWERARESGPEREQRRYFTADQRIGRYASAAREMSPGLVRESMITELSFFSTLDD